MRRFWLIGAMLLLLAVCAAFLWQTEPAMAASGPFIEYPVGSNPKNVAIDAAGNVWFTVPDGDKIGVLATANATLQVAANPTYYPTGAGSKPYDLVIDNNVVWFTLLGTNKIGRLDIGTGTIQQYTIPTPDSEPTGITFGAGAIWFVERKGDNLGKLDISTEIVTEYADKNGSDGNLVDMSGAELEDVAFANVGPWFTGPKFKTSAAFYRLSDGQFRGAPAGAGAQPTQIAVDSSDDVWLLASGTNRLGRFGLNTLGLWSWYDLPANAGEPRGLTIREASGLREIWYTRPAANSVGRQLARSSGVSAGQFETFLPAANGVPWGIAVDNNAGAWVALSSANSILNWTSPYFSYYTNMPVLRRATVVQ